MEFPENIQTLKALLSYVDSSSERFFPTDLESALSILAQRCPGAESEAGHAWYDEVAAAALILLDGDETDPWGLPYGPVMQGASTTGVTLTHPNLDRLDKITLDHWRRRAGETGNALLRGHYADLAWVFAERFEGKRDIQDAHMAIDGFVESLSNILGDQEVRAIQNGRRAMALALSIKDQRRQQRSKEGMFELAKRLEPVPFPLTRSFLLDGFGLGAFSKVSLTHQERTYMVWLLEDRLNHERDLKNSESSASVWVAENATQLLAAYYRKTDQPDQVDRVLTTFGEVVHHRAENAEPMVGQAWLGSLTRLCNEHGRKDLAGKAIRAIQALGPKVIGTLKQFGHSMEVPTEEMEKYLTFFTCDGLDKALGRLAIRLVPKWDEVEAITRENSKKFVFASLFPRTLLDGKGLPVIQVPPFHENPDAHMPMAFSQWITMEGFFRFKVIESIKEIFHPTPEAIVDWLLQSPAFQPERGQILFCGIRAYLENDFVGAMHLLIPQIEEAARTVVWLLGETTYERKPHPDGTRMDARSLHNILEGTAMNQVFSRDHIAFLRAVLVQPQGLNLRNRIAHGLLLPEEFSQSSSDIVFQCALILGLPRPVDESKPRGAE